MSEDIRAMVTRVVQEQLAMRGQFIEGLLVKAVAEHGVLGVEIVERVLPDGNCAWSVVKKQAEQPQPAPAPTLVEPDTRAAVDELAQLRADNAALKKEIVEAVEIIEADEHCLEMEFGHYEENDADRWLQRNKPVKDGSR